MSREAAQPQAAPQRGAPATTPAATPEEFAAALLGGAVELDPLTPEASARRYFRPRGPRALREGARWLVVVAPDPPPQASAAWLRGCGVHAPALGDAVPGAYLVEDLGDRHLVHAPAAERYARLLADWRRFTVQPLPDAHPNAALALDAALFRRELGLFQRHWAVGLQGAAPDAGVALLEELADAAAAGPWTVQHRDFHSRNLLLPTEHGAPAWIDHQDLRPGPLYYDLASLLSDAYVDLDDAVRALLRAEKDALGAAWGLAPAAAEAQWTATLLQRVLKALGTFAMLLERGRRDYAPAECRARATAVRLLEEAPRWSGLLPLFTLR